MLNSVSQVGPLKPNRIFLDQKCPVDSRYLCFKLLENRCVNFVCPHLFAPPGFAQSKLLSLLSFIVPLLLLRAYDVTLVQKELLVLLGLFLDELLIY